MMKDILDKINASLFTRENLIALVFTLILLTILIFSADRSPQWIYQGF